MVHDFVEEMRRRDTATQNRAQFAIASFAATHGKDWKPQDFLPWATEQPVAADTLAVLQELVDAGELSPRAEAAARARLKA
ncbi:hypothetical protein N836_31350 [Leptolyngbya sp. Heron Island J]|uniref:hypothetical protein n=1 Tax=Leptolyngbya sp. Heron Island J TaxID=1385935 RepID=UPI0003B9D54C|nr:hypothetical protein [Leptolyngbya sp. Heron Island J]ESA38438.1 hypothetical protein N836_31350 [Leptolyngbya sp. Heron Island J]